MFRRQQLELTGRELHEAEVLGSLQRRRRTYEEATRLVSQAEGVLERAKLREGEAAVLLAESLRAVRRVTQC
jgi:hypothetical protein